MRRISKLVGRERAREDGVVAGKEVEEDGGVVVVVAAVVLLISDSDDYRNLRPWCCI